MKTLKELRAYAQSTMTPIIRPQSAKILKELCQTRAPKRILEIGTAIGYSASLMLLYCPKAEVVTIEKDPQMIAFARQTFKLRGLEKRVTLMQTDAMVALEKLSSDGEKFDLIFLDGPKGQYFKYLPLLKGLLASKGVLLADDVLFHGYVKMPGDPGHKHRTIVASLRSFISDLQQDKAFSAKLIEIEDGLLLCERLN